MGRVYQVPPILRWRLNGRSGLAQEVVVAAVVSLACGGDAVEPTPENEEIHYQVLPGTRKALEVLGEPSGLNPGAVIGRLVLHAQAIEEYEAAAETDRAAAALARSKADELLAASERREVEVGRREALVLEAEAQLRRDAGMSRDAVQLLAGLVADGADRDQVLAWGRALAAAGVDPGSAAALMARQDIGGLVGWSRRLEANCQEAQGIADKLAREVRALREARDQLARQSADLEASGEALRQALGEGERYLGRLEGACRDLGAGLDFLHWQGVRRVDNLPALTCMALAAVLCLAAAESDDVEVVLPPDFPRRPVPCAVRASELGAHLVPAELVAGFRRASGDHHAYVAALTAPG